MVFCAHIRSFCDFEHKIQSNNGFLAGRRFWSSKAKKTTATDNRQLLLREAGYLTSFRLVIPASKRRLFVSIRNKPTFGGAKFWRTLLPKIFAMFNLNENNRFVMAQQPSDMRAGVNKT